MRRRVAFLGADRHRRRSTVLIDALAGFARRDPRIARASASQTSVRRRPAALAARLTPALDGHPSRLTVRRSPERATSIAIASIALHDRRGPARGPRTSSRIRGMYKQVLVGARAGAAAGRAAGGAACGASRAAHITTPKEAFGFNFGDDYQLANYKQIAAYWKKLDEESDRMVAARHRQDRRGADAVDGDRHLAGEPQEARALQGDLAAPRARRGADRRTGARAREGRQGGRLDRRRPARHRDARRAAARRDGLPDGQPQRRGDACGSSTTCIILFVHANPDGNDLVADWYMRNAGSEAADARTACRGSTRSTSATTTTATSSRRRRRRRRT